MPSKIITNGRLEYLEATIDVTYPDIGKVTYRGSRPLIVSNQWTPPVKMPAKGDLIMLDGKQYRVLKMTDTVAEVLAMYDANSSIEFGASDTYKDSTIDTYCNSTFYNGLPMAMKSAIVDKTFTQDNWYTVSSGPETPYYTMTHGTRVQYLRYIGYHGVSITRHCYCLSVQDVLDYLEATPSMDASNTTITHDNVLKMVWTQKPDDTKYIWLCSTNNSFNYAFFISSISMPMDYTDPSYKQIVRPAFQIDLSKIEWAPV